MSRPAQMGPAFHDKARPKGPPYCGEPGLCGNLLLHVVERVALERLPPCSANELRKL